VKETKTIEQPVIDAEMRGGKKEKERRCEGQEKSQTPASLRFREETEVNGERGDRKNGEFCT